ncbi:MAG: DNA polymerase II large subunit [Candidatus Thorarchaeota archaeon]
MDDSKPDLPVHTIYYDAYFESLNERIHKIYNIAETARGQGYDPKPFVEIPPAHDVAARVEATLGGPKGVANRIRELQKEMTREEVAFTVAGEIAKGDLGNMDDDEKAADKAVRVGLAILTESITAAPLEGIAKVRIRGSDSDKYLALYLAGPIRAAGGTEAAMTVLVADYVRQTLGLPPFQASDREIERAVEEVELYSKSVHLQYPVHSDLVRFASSKLPIMLTGEPTEEFEVSGSRDLDRVETNRVRGGSVLVLNDGVVGRASKLAKIVNSMKIKGWNWLNELAGKTRKEKEGKDNDATEILSPKSDYLADVIGGRPVFSHPSRRTGFRLRYGRSRNTGLAGVGVHPATMYLVESFLAPGTHIRTERPGKGSIVTPVDSIEGPIILLKNGTVKQIETAAEAREIQDCLERILYLGDIMIALGEFIENNHPLVTPGYCEEWWSHDLENACSQLSVQELEVKLGDTDIKLERLNAIIDYPLSERPTPSEAILLSEILDIPLHPRYTYRWPALSPDEFKTLRKWFFANYEIEETDGHSMIILPYDADQKELLCKAAIPHSLSSNDSRIQLSDVIQTVLAQFGDENQECKGDDALQLVNSVTEIPLRDRIGFSIGARMGRPEKAEERKMRPPVQVLFPVGRSLSSEREIQKVAEASRRITTLESFEGKPDDEGKHKPSGTPLEMVSRACKSCGAKTFESRCPECGSHTELERWCSQEDCGRPVDEDTGLCPVGHNPNLVKSTKTYCVDLEHLLEHAKAEIGEPQTYGVRGVLGLTSEQKVPEHLGKGILRAKHEVYCYRDGTARFDATDAPLTHFRPSEIGISIKRLRELGYTNDYEGKSLTSKNQILELKVQDLVVPKNCAEYLLRVGNFVDDSLKRIYDLNPYYKFRRTDDLIGQLVIGLAPHTSSGIIGRIIGFTDASLCYAHPYWHAAKRRNCDGDEDALILVLDALLNFSKSYLPAGRGGFMDAPLVLSVILDPKEVDDESHNIEICSRYPAAFYEMAAQRKHPKSVESLVDIIASRLGSSAQYEGFSFTHDTSSIDEGPTNTRYKTLGSMVDKLEAQLRLAHLIDAVDVKDVAERVLSHHFIRDIMGNLRAFSTQKVQCLKCRRVYRRIPLSGKCVCGKDLSLTVRQKNISKYLGIAQKMIEDYHLGTYLRQRLNLIDDAIDSLFFSEQTALTDFLE